MTRDTIRRFNRDTVWLATGVLGIVVFAALVLALQERQPKATQAERDFLLNPDSASVGRVIAKSFNTNGNMTPGPESSVDHAITETSLQETPSAQAEPAAPTSGLTVTPETNRHAHRQDSARVRGPKTRNGRNRSSVVFGSVDVKRRLIELWHQGFAKRKISELDGVFALEQRGH